VTPSRSHPPGHAAPPLRRIAQPTVRRLSLYLRFLEDVHERGLATVSSQELARLGGTSPAQVRKDLSVFGSFGKRGLGYTVAELITALRSILGLGREWRVVIVGAGKIGTALAQYAGFRQRGFSVVAVYDNDAAKIGGRWAGHTVRDVAHLESDAARERPDIAVLAVPAERAQGTADRIVRAGIGGILSFAPVQLHVPSGVTLQTVNMAAELEILSYALANRDPEDSKEHRPDVQPSRLDKPASRGTRHSG
jgi:redox-sensing transcriptional repressor